jgi:hypothetical protein
MARYRVHRISDRRRTGRSPGLARIRGSRRRSAEIEIAGDNEDLGAGIEKLLRGNAATGDVTFRVAIHHFQRAAQHSAFCVHVFYCHFGRLCRVGVVWCYETALGNGGADDDRIPVRRRRNFRAGQQYRNRQ